jgi:hypothetical protein
LYDSTGTIDLSATTNPFTFNTITGEFKITNFNGYFDNYIIVQVNGMFLPTS